MESTIGILLAGVLVVVGGVLVFRLHAFLALVLGALLVSALTSSYAIQKYSLDNAALGVVSADTGKDAGTITLQAAGKEELLQPGTICLVVRPDPQADALNVVADLQVTRLSETTQGETARRVAITRLRESTQEPFRLEPDDLVVLPRDLEAAEDLAGQTVGTRVATGFGNTCTKIGILIAMASIIGMCLLESGAADRIVRSALKIVGERGAPLAFCGSGFLLGIPVFFDTVFYLMIPLGKAMYLRTGRNYLLYVLTIVAGTAMAHSLVPPTPGPLFVAEQLGVEIGVMILAGCAVGLFSVTAGLTYAMIVNRIWTLPLRESPEFSLQDLEEISQRDESELPPTWLSLLPILLPVVLIGGYTVLNLTLGAPEGWSAEQAATRALIMGGAETLGDKNIALLIAAAIAMGTLIWQKQTSRDELARSVQASLATAGVIILITAAGGAFGEVLKQTGVAGLVRELQVTDPTVILLLAFLITVAVRTAQGSGTVSMITAVGIMGGFADPGVLNCHPVYLALAIGCGSKPIQWMNDSGFWVITKMSGMTETEGLKFQTPMSAMMGVVGILAVLIGARLFPLM